MDIHKVFRGKAAAPVWRRRSRRGRKGMQRRMDGEIKGLVGGCTDEWTFG
jgi:hypothetical protein